MRLPGYRCPCTARYARKREWSDSNNSALTVPSLRQRSTRTEAPYRKFQKAQSLSFRPARQRSALTALSFLECAPECDQQADIGCAAILGSKECLFRLFLP